MVNSGQRRSIRQPELIANFQLPIADLLGPEGFKLAIANWQSAIADLPR